MAENASRLALMRLYFWTSLSRVRSRNTLSNVRLWMLTSSLWNDSLSASSGHVVGLAASERLRPLCPACNLCRFAVRGGMGLVNRHFCVPAMRATLAVILAMGSPLAGGTLQMAGWRLFGSC